MELLFIGAALAFVGVLIAQAKNRSALQGCALGCLLGPIGWLILAFMSPRPREKAADGRPLRKCPYCAESILAEAVVCKYCGRDLPAAEITT